jgi:hypothetical protein
MNCFADGVEIIDCTGQFLQLMVDVKLDIPTSCSRVHKAHLQLMVWSEVETTCVATDDHEFESFEPW